MKYIMTTSMGRNGIKIATARVFTEPREAWDYALQLRVTPHCENCCFYLVGDETKPKKMKTRPAWCAPPEEPRDKYPEFCEELRRSGVLTPTVLHTSPRPTKNKT